MLDRQGAEHADRLSDLVEIPVASRAGGEVCDEALLGLRVEGTVEECRDHLDELPAGHAAHAATAPLATHAPAVAGSGSSAIAVASSTAGPERWPSATFASSTPASTVTAVIIHPAV